jgi:hypothetical protein
MTTKAKISDLTNYTKVLNAVKDDSAVELTKNGNAVYFVISPKDFEEFETYKARMKIYNDLVQIEKDMNGKEWTDADSFFDELENEPYE